MTQKGSFETLEDMPAPPESGPVSGLDHHAPTLAATYTVSSLDADQRREILSLSRLPPWPAKDGEPEAEAGHGWGYHLHDMLGGGLAPGEMTAVGAASAGAGKTAWLMQVAEGLALRNVHRLRDSTLYGPQLTPVIVASEMSAQALTWRSLARWTGYPATIFRGGETVARNRRAEAAEAWRAARKALSGGPLADSRAWLRLLKPGPAMAASARGAEAFADHLRRTVDAWRGQITRDFPSLAVVPIVVVDPVQRYQAGDDDEVSALNALARALCAATDEGGWVTFMTSDTNKEAASGKAAGSDSERAVGAFRGSYKLQHEVVTAITLQRPAGYEQSEDEARDGIRHVEIVVAKNRWGGAAPPWPRYIWHTPTMRFWPQRRERAEELASEEKLRPKAGAPSRKGGRDSGGEDGRSNDFGI